MTPNDSWTNCPHKDVVDTHLTYIREDIQDIKESMSSIIEKLDNHTKELAETTTKQKLQSGGLGAAGGGIIVFISEIARRLFI